MTSNFIHHRIPQGNILGIVSLEEDQGKKREDNQCHTPLAQPPSKLLLLTISSQHTTLPPIILQPWRFSWKVRRKEKVRGRIWLGGSSVLKSPPRRAPRLKAQVLRVSPWKGETHKIRCAHFVKPPCSKPWALGLFHYIKKIVIISIFLLYYIKKSNLLSWNAKFLVFRVLIYLLFYYFHISTPTMLSLFYEVLYI